MDLLALAVLGLLAVAGATALSSRLGVAAPLLLVLAGIGVSLLPFVPELDVEPEWILAGVLPPLLYSAAVSMPAMDFRREFPAIGGLSVLLVVVTAVVLGAFLSWVVPGLDLWWGIALGAVISPTDAVATSIVKQVGVSGRVVSILEGESLLNDATALVLLRTAVVGAATSVTLGGVLGDFAFAVAVAVAIGFVVGKLNLWVRERVADATVNTVLSFTVPFLASLPAEALGASGLVAAVVAGLVTGHGAPRRLSPRHRLSDAQNWRTVELVLEGAVFLVLGLELTALLGDVEESGAGVGTAVLLAVGALVVTVLVRAAYVAPLLWTLHHRSRRAEGLRPRLAELQERLDAWVASVERGEPRPARRRPGPGGREERVPSAGRLQRFQTRIRRSAADIDYLLAAPLGWREGSVVVWAGMRGAVTVAAAQTLPVDAPDRSLLVLVAFLVAVASLLLQGGTLGWLVRRVTPAGPDGDAAEQEERARVLELMSGAAASVLGGEMPVRRPDADPEERNRFGRQRMAVNEAQRQALLDARDDGLFSADTLQAALAVLDADQIGLELRGRPADR